MEIRTNDVSSQAFSIPHQSLPTQEITPATVSMETIPTDTIPIETIPMDTIPTEINNLDNDDEEVKEEAKLDLDSIIVQNAHENKAKSLLKQRLCEEREALPQPSAAAPYRTAGRR